MHRSLSFLVVVLLSLSCARTTLLHDRRTHPSRALRDVFERLDSQSHSSRVKLLPGNVASWAERWKVLDHARERIDVTYFIVRSDVFGNAFLGKLLQKAREGVHIRLMIDQRGSYWYAPPWRNHPVLQLLAAEKNVTVRIYNPLAGGLAGLAETLDVKRLVASNHDKIIVADGRDCIIGGRNISTEYFADVREIPLALIDLDMFLDGEGVARDLTRAFDIEFHARENRQVAGVRHAALAAELLAMSAAMDAWLSAPPIPEDSATAILVRSDLRQKYVAEVQHLLLAAGRGAPQSADSPSLRAFAEELAGLPFLRGTLDEEWLPRVGGEVRVLDTYSVQIHPREHTITAGIERMIDAARHEIVIHNPYIILNRDTLDVLRRAAARGVRIIVLTNSPTSTDSAIAPAFLLRAWRSLLGAVPTMRLFVVGEGQLVHSKVFVVDGMLTVLGSYNLEPLSMQVNSEVVAAVWSEEFAWQNLAVINEQIAAGAPYVLEYRIKRDARGRPILHARGHPLGGEPVAEFGPEDHCDPVLLGKIAVIQQLVEIARGYPLLRPLM